MAPRITRRGLFDKLLFSWAKDPAPATRTLVCVFLRGGADTLSMFVPHGDPAYYEHRPMLGVAAPGTGKDAALPLNDFYGLHPRMAPLLPLFREGRMAVIQGVGHDNPTGSHFEAQDQIEHGAGFGQQPGGGWLGRHLRARASSSPLSAIAFGPGLPEALRGAPSANAISQLEDLQLALPPAELGPMSAALGQLYGARADLLGDRGRETLALLDRVQGLRERPYDPKTTYPDTPFGKGLRETARLIKADVGLEVACVDLEGWDTHFIQGTLDGLAGGLVEELASALAAFEGDLGTWRPRVTTLVLTEFGRRVYENGSLGTDHGRGFAAMVFGDRLDGGRVHGVWPGLEEDQQEGPGGLPVKIDYRAVLSEVLRDVAGPKVDLSTVFPGFSAPPLGLRGA